MTQDQQQGESSDETNRISQEALERQILREHSLGAPRLENKRAGARHAAFVAQRGIQYLLEEAILSLLIDEVPSGHGSGARIGDLRERLRASKLEPVRAALRTLTSARKGQQIGRAHV